jgi:hypothetical protein
MKNLSRLLLVLFALSMFDVYGGEDEDERRRRRRRSSTKFEIGINPVAYIWGTYNVIAGLHLSEQSSIFLEIAYNRNSFPYRTVDSNNLPVSTDVVYNGFSVAPEYRYYFNPDDDNDKWFIGGYLNFRYSSTSGAPYAGIDQDENFVSYDLTNFAVAPGFTVGYEWVTKSGLTFTLWSGLGYALIYTETKDPDFVASDDPFFNIYNVAIDTFNRLDFRGGFTIGYRFE